MRQPLLAIWLLTLFTVVGMPSSAAEAIRHGPWEVTLDASSGNWKAIRWKGAAVAESAPAKMNDIYTDRGFRSERASRASVGDDVETATYVWREGRELHLRFQGLLRNQDRFGIVRPPIWFLTEYVFDESPTFRLRWSLSSEGPVRETTAFVAWMARLPDLRRFAWSRGGKEVANGLADASARTGQTSQLPGRPVPDAAALSDDHGTLLRVTDLATHGPAPLQNIFVHGQNFFLAWLDGPATPWAPGPWHECRLALTVGEAAPVAASPIPWKVGAVDLSFGLPDGTMQHRSICGLTGSFDWRPDILTY